MRRGSAAGRAAVRSPVRVRFALYAALGASGLAACVSVQRPLPEGGVEYLRGKAVRAYAEEVFRRHNAVATALLYLSPRDGEGVTPGDAGAQPLSVAEDAMYDACEPLNALAIAYRDGETLPLAERRRLLDALAPCELATAEVEDLLSATGNAP